jgi:hypothetical protein
MRHGHKNFLGEFLVGVYRHPIGEFYPSKYSYENPTLGELDRRSRHVATSLFSSQVSFFASSSVMMINPYSEYHRVYGGGADDRVER